MYANRRRSKGARSKRLQRQRSERVERSFAHVCETGGGRRRWIRGIVEVSKRNLIQVAAHNLGILMRKLIGIGTPRSLQGSSRVFSLSRFLSDCLHLDLQIISGCLQRFFQPESSRRQPVAIVQVAA